MRRGVAFAVCTVALARLFPRALADVMFVVPLSSCMRRVVMKKV